ncbi:MAG: NAD(P)-dependent glycerol-3-phosphate dehydrogenase [Proteobacteria bacterium]|nr:NAD(P)-dependent glycerol-3-phosphate dehydrogenase [Pseudomonadota bacterium]
MKHAAIIGAGAWGTAIAQTLSRAGLDATLWAHEAATVDAINATRENPVFLKGVTLEKNIRATSDLGDAVSRADLLVWVTPAQHLRATLSKAAPHLPAGVPLILATKGVETGTGKLMSDIAAELAPGRAIAVLSGPSFAREVALGKPTAVTIAAADGVLAAKLAAACATPTFRVYSSTDVPGTQVGGAVKNVLAVACGIVAGKELGDNARAALMTRGLAEMVRLGVAIGGQPETLMGLSGLGDLSLTCNNDQSRNMRFGIALGRGFTKDQALSDPKLGLVHAAVEGIDGAISVNELAKLRNVEMPICAAVYDIVHRGADPDAAMRSLLARPLKEERA